MADSKKKKPPVSGPFGRHPKQGARPKYKGPDGKWHTPKAPGAPKVSEGDTGFQNEIYYVAANVDKIDWNKFWNCMTENAAKDLLIGLLSRRAGANYAKYNPNRPVGIGAGCVT